MSSGRLTSRFSAASRVEWFPRHTRSGTLSVMRRISNSIALAKSSWAVLKTDKELAVIPVLSFLATLAVMALAGGGVYFSLTEKVTQPGNSTSCRPRP